MLKVFVGYGYHERDRWIEEIVFDLVRASGFEPVNGKEIYGEGLAPGIEHTISTCYGLLGFTTKRQDADGQQDGTHRWVIEELLMAEHLQKPSIEIMEQGLAQHGSRIGKQFIQYVPQNREPTLIELIKALGKWRLSVPMLVKLIPEDVINEIRPILSDPGLRCTYTVMQDGNELAPKEGKLRKMQGGLCVELRGVDASSLVSVSIFHGNKIWESGFDSLYTTIEFRG